MIHSRLFTVKKFWGIFFPLKNIYILKKKVGGKFTSIEKSLALKKNIKLKNTCIENLPIIKNYFH
jgi:hypothetical protein